MSNRSVDWISETETKLSQDGVALDACISFTPSLSTPVVPLAPPTLQALSTCTHHRKIILASTIDEPTLALTAGREEREPFNIPPHRHHLHLHCAPNHETKGS